jgi:co-chaperonin GroES (HSP10)
MTEDYSPLTKFRPLYDFVALVRVPEPGHSGLIIVPKTAQDNGHEAVVVAKGPGICNWKNGSWLPLAVEVGDRVLISNRYGGQEVEILGRKCLVVRQDDIGAVLDPPIDAAAQAASA